MFHVAALLLVAELLSKLVKAQFCFLCPVQFRVQLLTLAAATLTAAFLGPGSANRDQQSSAGLISEGLFCSGGRQVHDLFG